MKKFNEILNMLKKKKEENLILKIFQKTILN